MLEAQHTCYQRDNWTFIDKIVWHELSVLYLGSGEKKAKLFSMLRWIRPLSLLSGINLTQNPWNVVHAIIWQQQTQVWFLADLCISGASGSHVWNRQGQLTGFSLFNLQGYTSLVHFIYSHYRLVPSATQGPVEHTYSHAHTLSCAPLGCLRCTI